MDRGKGESEKKPTEREKSEWKERGERERLSVCERERGGLSMRGEE